MSTQTINEKIKQYLDDNKIKISFLANQTGMGQSNLKKLLDGNGIRVSHLISISKALGLNVGYFLNEEITQTKGNKELAQELVKIRNEAYQAIKFGDKLAASFAINDLDTFIHKNF